MQDTPLLNRIVVVGGGVAGMRSATALRDEGFEGELVLLGAEPHPPYDRPPLSKRALLAPEPYDSTLPFDAEALGIDLRLGVRAIGLATDSRVVHTDAGDVPYDGLVIASGSEPVRLPGQGAHYLRTKEDAAALRGALRSGAQVIVVGAGWIAAEVTTAALAHDCEVVVLEQAATPVAHALPAEIGRRMAEWYAAAGADLRCRQRVSRVEPRGVVLADGSRLEADAVVVGIGVRPATDWLAGSGVRTDRGVLVGPDLRTDVPGVVAVGDAAARWSPRYRTLIRSEHWDEAMRAPLVAAANLLGGERVFDPVPYVWSEQFGRMVQFAGLLDPGTVPALRPVHRGDPGEEASWAVFWLDASDRLAAILTVGRPRDFVRARKLAEAGTPVDPVRLADPSTPVERAVAGSGV